MPDLLPQGQKAPPPKKEDKQPSRFFTEYYAAAFLFLIALFVLSAVLLLKPIIDDIKETNAQTQSEIAAADASQMYLNSLEGSISAAQTISPDVLSRVSQALPTSSEIPVLLVQFGSAAYSNGVRIEGLAFNESKAAPKPASGIVQPSVSPVDITLTLRARSYFDVKRFLASLETSLRVIDVIGISSGGGEAEVSYSLQLRTYVFNQAGTSPAVK